MKLNDVRLQRHYERAISLMPTLPGELLPIIELYEPTKAPMVPIKIKRWERFGFPSLRQSEAQR